MLDLGNVIVRLAFERAYRALREACPLDVEQVRARLNSADLFVPYESGLIGSEEFYRRCKNLLEFDLAFDEFAAVWCDVFEPAPLLGEQFVERLVERCDVTIASNTNPLHFEHLERSFPILKRLPRRALSFELGAVKPGRAFFERALKIAERSASECLFVDDREENVQGARAAGIDAAVFRSESGLLADLSRRGMLTTSTRSERGPQ